MNATDQDQIRALSPFAELDQQALDTVLVNAKVIDKPAGKVVFKRDEADSNIYWLLSGALDLLDESFEARVRTAADDASRYVLDNHNPHRLTAVATQPSRLLVLPRDIAEQVLSESVMAGTNQEEVEEEDVDWMSTLLSSPLFEFVPPVSIQALFSKFVEINYGTGEAVIRQGDEGDYFYVLHSGRAKVERSNGGKVLALAELRPGDNFGQDALISSAPRNATVTMTQRGKLMRLSKDDFESLLMEPVIETVSVSEAEEMVRLGDPRTYLLDVRNPKELESGKRPGSLNVPLLLLRRNLDRLKPDAIYITLCDDGRRSALAAYILNENGFAAYVMDAGET